MAAEIPLFATSNLTSLEPYLFLDHPKTFVSLTEDEAHEYHHRQIQQSASKHSSNTLPHQQQLRHHTTLHPPSTTSRSIHPREANPSMKQRTSSTSSTTSITSTISTLSTPSTPTTSTPLGTATTLPQTQAEDYLGGGATRPHHSIAALEELALLERQARERRARAVKCAHHAGAGCGGEAIMAWWPESVECMRWDWGERFYE